MNPRAASLRVALLVMTVLLPASLFTHPATAGASPETQYAGQTLRLVNAERSERGLPALVRSSCLQRYASLQARKMATQGRIFHQPLRPVVRACGLAAWAENVAYDSRGSTTMVAGWMGSAVHRRNILSTQFRQIGVGAARGVDGAWYVAHVFGRQR